MREPPPVLAWALVEEDGTISRIALERENICDSSKFIETKFGMDGVVATLLMAEAFNVDLGDPRFPIVVQVQITPHNWAWVEEILAAGGRP